MKEIEHDRKLSVRSCISYDDSYRSFHVYAYNRSNSIRVILNMDVSPELNAARTNVSFSFNTGLKTFDYCFSYSINGKLMNKNSSKLDYSIYVHNNLIMLPNQKKSSL